MGHRIVRFSDKSDRYYDFFDRKLHRNDGSIIQSRFFRGYEQQLLELLVDSPGTVFSREYIMSYVKGEDSVFEPKTVDNHILNLRKIIDKPLKETIFEARRGRGYLYIGTEATGEESLPVKTSGLTLPHILTKSVIPFADSRSVIHRNCEINEIERILLHGKTALLLSGFGGIGKTSIAQAVCSRIAPIYDSIGWIEYHGNLKDSLLAAIELNDDIPDVETRWRAISFRLKNDRTKKLLVIDNVDRDIVQQQDPIGDVLIKEIAGWPDLTILLTSRIAELPGYNTYYISALGSNDHPEPCVDLFYFYYDKSEFDKPLAERKDSDIVYELVKLAGFHTYAIELLARSAFYEDTLSVYLQKIKEVGFKFPTLSITTRHHSNSASAAEQLRLLFNLRSRTKCEQQILWDFSVLPEGIALTNVEVSKYLSYDPNDLDSLCQDSWLRYKKGQGFYIHPLIKEVIHFDLKNDKAPTGTVRQLINLVITGQFISEDDSQPVVLRKLNILETTSRYIDFSTDEDEADFYYKLGSLEYNFARRRLTSISYLEQSLRKYQSLQKSGPIVLYRVAELKYQLGYIKSTTQKYRNVSKKDLQTALDMWTELDGHDKEVAMAHDHLGYVLTDNKRTYESAREHLTKALEMWTDIVGKEKSQDNLRAYATTCDNLGFLLSKIGGRFEEASELLEKALKIRDDIYARSGQHGTDVAWTLYNLGKHLSNSPNSSGVAEKYFERSLEIRRGLERMHPGMYTTNIVFSLVALAKHISKAANRMDEVTLLTKEAEALRLKIDSEHTGFFSEDIDADLAYLNKKIHGQ